MKKQTLGNKKALGRGMRNYTGLRSHANTSDLKKVLIYLKFKKEDSFTNIAIGIGVNGYKVKDALLFLIGTGLVSKEHPTEKKNRSNSRTMFYYKLTNDKLYEKQEEN